MSTMRWMEIAWAQVGVHETPGPKATNEIVAFFRDAGHPEIVSDETAWCAAFVGACLERAGVRSTRSLMARSYLEFGTPIDVPRIGAIAIFRRNGDPSSGHVNFVTGWTETKIKGLGGNQHDAVNEAWFERSELIALRWPGEPVTTSDLVAQGSRIAGTAEAQQGDARKGIGALGLGEAATQWANDAIGAVQRMVDQVAGLKGSLVMLEPFLTFVLGKGRAIGTTLAVFFLLRMAWRAGWIKVFRAEDASTGKTGP